MHLDQDTATTARPALVRAGVAAPTRVRAALIATFARVLAASATRGKTACVVMDCAPAPQGRANPHHWCQAGGIHRQGHTDFDGAELIRQLAGLPTDWATLPVIYGAGFDHRPELLARIARHHRLLGNEVETLGLMSDPASFADIADHLGLPHAMIRDSLPQNAIEWLARHVGDEFDRDTQLATSAGPDRPGRYFQRALPGASMMAIFAADGRQARVLGFAECVHQGLMRVGAIGGVPVKARVARGIANALDRLTAEFGLIGFNRLEFTLAGEHWWATRLTARLTDETALIDALYAEGALALHLAAVEGHLPRVIEDAPVVGMRRVIAPRPILIDRRTAPDWVLDPPTAGHIVDRGETLCTVVACANTHDEVRAKLTHRAESLIRPVSKLSM